jgi:GNAT superfamily N-acetyltransferase
MPTGGPVKTLLDLSQTEKPAHIQENLIAYMRLFAGLPGIHVHDSDSFWIVSRQGAPGDMVLRANWPDENVEEHIDLLFEQVGQQIDHIDWMVFPGDRPADLNQRLEARGMPGGPGGTWLWADLASIGPGPTVPAEFHIEPVRSDAQLAEWVRLSEAGFEADLGRFYDAYARHGYGPGAFSRHYTGYLGNTPVTTGTLLNAGSTASIYDVSTPPAYRHQGLGGAITHALMREVRSLGYADTWIWSSPMAKSVYQALGYVEADFGLREHAWRRG